MDGGSGDIVQPQKCERPRLAPPKFSPSVWRKEGVKKKGTTNNHKEKRLNRTKLFDRKTKK